MNNDELHTDLFEAVRDIKTAACHVEKRAFQLWTRLNTAEREALQAGGVNDSWAVEVDRLEHQVREQSALLERLKSEGGSIVGANKLTPMAIALGQAASRMYVDKDGFGFVHIPPQEFKHRKRPGLRNMPNLGPEHTGDEE